jgi:predicted nucleic acid-binding protein
MNLVDSSCWLEWFAKGPNALSLRQAIGDTARLLVPTVVLLEVYKRLLQQQDEHAAMRAAAYMRQGTVVELDADLAMLAAQIGHQTKLPLADSIILATARTHSAVLWTQDAHFQSLPAVRYFPK